MSRTYYMGFAADAPMVGLDPHPAWAPQETISSFDAKGYAEALGAYETRAEALLDLGAHNEALQEAVEAGDLEDAEEMDDIFRVEIHDDGRIDVWHEDPDYVFASCTMAEIYDAYGMKMPGAPA